MFATSLACVIVCKINLFFLNFLLVSEILMSLSESIGISDEVTGLSENKITAYRFFIPLILVVFIIFPLALMRNLSSIRYLSLGALVALSITLLVVIIEMPFYVRDYHPSLPDEEKNINAVCASFSFFNGVGITFFAYTN